MARRRKPSTSLAERLSALEANAWEQEAMIVRRTGIEVDWARIANVMINSESVESSDFVTGTSGWQILGDGNAEFNSVTIRDSLYVMPAGTSFPTVDLEDGQMFHRTDLNKVFRYDLGNTEWLPLDYIDDGARIANLVVGTGHIENLAVETAKIDDLAVTNAKVNDLSAEKINVGTLNVDRIGSNSIDRTKIIGGGTENTIVNGDFRMGAAGEGDDPNNYAPGNGTWASTTDAQIGDTAVKYTVGSQTLNAIMYLNGQRTVAEAHLVCQPGDVIVAMCRAKYSGVAPVTNARLYLVPIDKDDVVISWQHNTELTGLTTAYQEYDINAVMPAGTVYVVLAAIPTFGSNSASVVFYFDGFEMRKAINTSLLEDEAVTSIKIADDIQSDNYSQVGGSEAGWKIERNTGNAWFNDVTIRGALYAIESSVKSVIVDPAAWGSIPSVIFDNNYGADAKIRAETNQLNIEGPTVSGGAVARIVIEMGDAGDGGDIRIEGNDNTIWLGNNSYPSDYVKVEAWQFLVKDGTAALPSISFISDAALNTGIYRAAENIIGFSAGGTQRFSIDASGTTVTGRMDFTSYLYGPKYLASTDGTATTPAFSWWSDQNTGVYRIGENLLGFSAGAALRGYFQAPALNQGAGVRNTGKFVVDAYSSNLGGTAGNSVGGQSWAFDGGDNLVNLEMKILRIATGTDWTTAAIGFQRITDSTAQGSLWFHQSRIGVNDSGPVTTLSVSGAISCKPGTTGSTSSGYWGLISGTYYEWKRYTSSLRYKSRVSKTGKYVDHLADLDIIPYQFWRKDDKQWQFGLVSEHLYEQDPFLVNLNEEGQPEDPDPMALITVLAAKINRLEKEVAELKAAA